MSARNPAAGPTAGTVLVLGGAGFVGRHAVAALLDAGVEVIVGTRHPRRQDARLHGAASRCKRLEIRFERCLDSADWDETLAGIDAVINCVGILRPVGRASYDRVHHLAPAALASACRARGLRMVHVSALGLDGAARSGFLISKRRGEQALRASGADVFVARPALLDGRDGYGARWIRRVADWPLHPLPVDAHGRLAVLDVAELGECLAALATLPGDACPATRIVELGGPHLRTMAEHLCLMRAKPGRPLPVRLPHWVARAASHLCDAVHLTPFSFGHYELLQRDNAPALDHTALLLGREPRAVYAGRLAPRGRDAGPLPLRGG